MRSKVHKIIYFVGLCIIAFFLPLSEYITNAAIFLIIANWFVELKFIEKFNKLKENKSILVFLILFFVDVLWLINTKNLDFGLHDIRIKLPLLALPVIIGTSNSLSKNKITQISQILILGVLISTLAGLLSYFQIIHVADTENVRNLSVFVSHIRLSIMICLSIILIFYFFFEKIISKIYVKILAIIIAILFFVFLVMIQGFTGLVSLVVVGLISLGMRAYAEESRVKKISYYSFIVGLPLLLMIFFGMQIRDFYTPTVDRNIVKTHTESGNKYYHDENSGLLENGNLIYVDICEKELYAEWTKLSDISLDGEGGTSQSVLHTLIRYLTSKGLTKDAVGMAELSGEDIRLIENGNTNYKYAKHQNLNKRIYNIIWQIDVYNKGGNPSGHSITQRFEYLKAGLILSYRNFLFGTGTGDIDDAYKSLYIDRRSQLDSQYRHRAHNQFLTFFVSFGVFGAIFCFIAIFIPVVMDFKSNNFYFAVFLLIAILSMLTDDTLETTTGVAFFAFFYSLFLWGRK